MVDSKGHALSNTAHEYAECSAKVRAKEQRDGGVWERCVRVCTRVCGGGGTAHVYPHMPHHAAGCSPVLSLATASARPLLLSHAS